MMHLRFVTIAFLIPAIGNPIYSQPPAAKELDTAALIAKLAKVKDYEDDRVTMSPDRDLLEGFKEWGDDGLQYLRKALKDEIRDVRHHSVLLLAELPGGNDLLLETLQDESSSMRGEILGMIGYVLRDRRFIPAAAALIDSKDAALSKQAIGVAGRTHYLAVANDLMQIMKSDDKSRSVAAAYALAKMNVPDGAKLICDDARENVEIPLWQGKVIDTLGGSGSPDAVEYLLELFEKGMKMTKADDEPAGMMFSAAEHKELLNGKSPKGAGIMLTGRSASAIAAIGHRTAMPILHQGLSHPNKHVRSAALRAISAGDPTAGKVLLEKLKTTPQQELAFMFYAISRTGDTSLVNEIKKTHLDGPGRDDAIAALAVLGDQSIVKTAIENSKSEDMGRKQMGAIAVAAISNDSEKARERLAELFDDPSPQIRYVTFSSIPMQGVNESIESVVLKWVKNQKDPKEISQAITALARVGGPDSLDYLRSLAESKSANVRYSASLCLATITGAEQIFVRDSGEKVKVVLTSRFAAARRSRLASEASGNK